MALETNTLYPGDPLWLEKLRRMHPFKLFMYVSIAGITILFLFLTAAFIFSPKSEMFYLPTWFAFSTLVLLLSSFTVLKAQKSYLTDKPALLNRYLVATFLLALLFVAFQMLGWKELRVHNVYFRGDVNGSYLYLLSGLHLLHFFGGMIYFLFVYFRAFAAYRDSVKNLIYVTDPYEKMLIDLLALYWHFVDILWVVMYLVFVYYALS